MWPPNFPLLKKEKSNGWFDFLFIYTLDLGGHSIFHTTQTKKKSQNLVAIGF